MGLTFDKLMYDDSLYRPAFSSKEALEAKEKYPGFDSLVVSLGDNVELDQNVFISKNNQKKYTIRYSTNGWSFGGGLPEVDIVFAIRYLDKTGQYEMYVIEKSGIKKPRDDSWGLNDVEDGKKYKVIAQNLDMTNESIKSVIFS